MSSDTVTSNLAISHLGIGSEIQNLESDTSAEAKACRRYYEISLRRTLADFDWPFARKVATLNLVGTEPNKEWNYSYRYPSDCVHFRRIRPTPSQSGDSLSLPGTGSLRFARVETRQSRVPYQIGKDTTARLIFTDLQYAIGEYTEYVSDVSFFPPEFQLSHSFLLAYYIASRVTGGDQFNLKQEMLAQYRVELSIAQANALNQEQPDEEPPSELQRCRE